MFNNRRLTLGAALALTYHDEIFSTSSLLSSNQLQKFLFSQNYPHKILIDLNIKSFIPIGIAKSFGDF